MFSKIGEHIDMAVVVLKQYPVFLPHLYSGTLPKANLLLYRRGRKCISLAGLDHLSVPDVFVPRKAHKRPGFSLLTRRADVFNRLRAYFEAIKKSPTVLHVKTGQQYRDHLAGDPLPRHLSATIESLVQAAEENDQILHVVLCGSVAKRLLGLVRRDVGHEHEMDIDALVVYQHRLEADASAMRASLLRYISAEDHEIVWGPDERSFYPWRKDDKVNIDIELLPAGTVFYSEHPLLGTSIMSYIFPVYAASDALSSTVSMPIWPATARERWSILLEDRKGLLEFIRYLDKRQCPIDLDVIDYRRIITWVLRDTAWAITGHHYPSTNTVLKFLHTSWQEIFANTRIEEIRQVLGMTMQEARENRDSGVKAARSLAMDGAEWAHREIKARN